MKKILSLSSALVLTISMLSGCGGSSTSSAASTTTTDTSASAASTATTKEETVTISFWDGIWNEESFPAIQKLWDAQYPNIKLEPEFQIDKGMSDKYMLSLQNGTAPDVVACALDWVTTYGSAGLLAPLDEYVAADSVDKSIYVPGAIAASTIGGKLYGLPFRSETYALYYNKDILSAAGFTEPPKTWDELKTIAAATNSADISGFGLCGANYGNVSFQYITMLRSSGGDILNADSTASTLDSPAAIATAQLYKDLSAYAPASMLENDNVANRTLFASGKIAMYLSPIYDLPEIIKANPDLNFACSLVPTAAGTDRKTILGGWSVAIPESSKNKEAAWKFVKFLTSPEVASLYTNTFTGTGAPAAKFASFDASIIQPHSDALQYAAALPFVGSIVPIRQTIFDNLVLSLSTDLTPEAAIKQASDAVNVLLKEEK